ncbi:MAG: phosphatase [Peptoniphilaceae bacterium]|nr:phosphatase [Peptoniphilaceae bacterium]MDY6085823.1 phosphatase [Peptoniphilaceae bacterium]
MQALMDLHTHTVASVHAYSTLTENAREAKKNGLEILGVSDHGYGMPHTTLPEYWHNIKVIPPYLEGVRILKGIEMNLYDMEGTLYEEELLDKVDYVIASLHLNTFKDDPNAISDYTDVYVHALERYPQITIIGHPDDGHIPLDYERFVKACKEHHVAVEMNCSSLMPGAYRKNARENQKAYLELCREYDVPVIIDSDAHMSVHVGVFDRAYEVLSELDYPTENVVNFSWGRLEELLGRAL